MSKKLLRSVLFVLLAGLLLASCAMGPRAESTPGISAGENQIFVSYLNYVYKINPTNGIEDWRYPEKSNIKQVFYRIAQEGLNNIFKHAEATKVWFRFSCSEAVVALTVSDDGLGFVQDDVPAGHLGLGIMHERAESIGADLSLVSQPGEGTTLRLVWHFSRNAIK